MKISSRISSNSETWLLQRIHPTNHRQERAGTPGRHDNTCGALATRLPERPAPNPSLYFVSTVAGTQTAASARGTQGHGSTWLHGDSPLLPAEAQPSSTADTSSTTAPRLAMPPLAAVQPRQETAASQTQVLGLLYHCPACFLAAAPHKVARIGRKQRKKIICSWSGRFCSTKKKRKGVP